MRSSYNDEAGDCAEVRRVPASRIRQIPHCTVYSASPPQKADGRRIARMVAPVLFGEALVDGCLCGNDGVL